MADIDSANGAVSDMWEVYMNNAIDLNKSLFQLLQNNEFGWKYEDYSYTVKGDTVNSGFISFDNQYFYDKYGSTIKNIVIKLRYEISEKECCVLY